MAGRRHDDGRPCLCDRPDGSCAGLAVRRQSSDRIRELAEEIWTASTGVLLPAHSLSDPRSSRAGASAQAAYRRHRDQERERWRLGWLCWTYAVFGAAAVGALVTRLTIGDWLGGPMALLVAVWAGWRLRFRPSVEVSIWRRQAAMQRRTASMLGPLADEGYLVLHDVTLPGWLGSLEHLVVGSTGVWVVQSWQRQGRLPSGAVPAGVLRELQSQTQAIVGVLDGWSQVPVRPLLYVHRAWLGTRPTHGNIQVTACRRLAQVVRSGSPVAPCEVGRTTGRLLEMLRPAA
jgi:hypothetical protein